MLKKYKNYLIVLCIMAISLAIFFSFKLFLSKQSKLLPEVKLREIKDSKAFAIMVQNGDGYEEFKNDNNKWPGSEYVYKEAKCIDNKGSLINGNIITFDNDTVTIETDKTVYCTLYFDEKTP